MSNAHMLRITLERRDNAIIVIAETPSRENAFAFTSEVEYNRARAAANVLCGDLVRVFQNIPTIVICNNITPYDA